MNVGWKHPTLHQFEYLNSLKMRYLKFVFIFLLSYGFVAAQDPNDEPASVLLEKIKEEKEKLAHEQKGKKTNDISKKEKSNNVAAEKKVKYKKRKGKK